MKARNKTGNVVDNDKSNAVAAGQNVSMTLAQVREQLKGSKGKKYWRSVDELANTAEFQAAVEKEFPSAAQEWVDPVSRRGFMKLMGASMALAGLAGCAKQPDEQIYPYVKQPEDLVLGKSNYFATANPFVSGAVPLLVKSDQFRPIKIDGNPDHAYNQGRRMCFRRVLCSIFMIRTARSTRPSRARIASGRSLRWNCARNLPKAKMAQEFIF